MKKKNKVFLIIFFVLALLAVAIFAVMVTINYHVKNSVKARIFNLETVKTDDYDCIFVLGCGVRPDGSPSDMLRDRLETAYLLYEAGLSDCILVSGDNGKIDYNEVGVMKEYLVNKGIPEGKIYMDHAGFSTYESLYRAKAIFGVEKMILVTQKYHLSRALYIAYDRGIDAVGVGADFHIYRGQEFRDLREVLARVKDFIWCVFEPAPTYLGQRIQIG